MASDRPDYDPEHAAPDTDVAIETANEPGMEGDAESGRLGRSTAFFSIATGFSRMAGLVREIVAASYFGVTGPMSAFTIAFQLPNLVRMLFADAALQAAFVPVFTEQLEAGNRRERLPPRLDLVLPGHRRARLADRALHPRRAA